MPAAKPTVGNPNVPDLRQTMAHLRATVEPSNDRYAGVPEKQRDQKAAYDAIFQVMSELEHFGHACPMSIHVTREEGKTAITAVASFPVTIHRLQEYTRLKEKQQREARKPG